MTRTLFVSDVHLRPNDDDGRNGAFFEFLEQDCDALYLVGDIFDYWIGPKHLQGPDYAKALEALRRRARKSRTFFIRGNRDYMVDEKFEKATGIAILGDRARIEIGDRTVLLAHGDFVYNTNAKYTAYRTMARSKPIRDLWLQIPAVAMKRLIGGFRKVSVKTTPQVRWEREEILSKARPLFEQGADVLICGHIHQPRHESAEIGGRRRDVYLMGDWCGGTRDYVEHDGRGFRFTRWS